MDIFIGYSYSYIIRSISFNQIVATKCAFESEIAKQNIKVKEYCAHNGRFTDLDFKLEVEKCSQKITFLRIGTHWQNRIIERFIRKITMRGQIILLYAKCVWLEAITNILWLFTVSDVIHLKNTVIVDGEGKTLL